MRLPSRPSSSAFTMIELITVIAVIAILMAVLTPVVSNMMGTARRSSDANNLRQLAMATIAYLNESGATRSASFTDVNDWALSLAKAGNFNEPSLFFVQGDPALPAALPTKIYSVITNTNNGTTTVTDTLDSTFSTCALSVAAAKMINLNNPASSTPLVWTRGLDPATGSWSSSSPYGTKGGYVAFLDGHVAFYKQVPVDTIAIPASGNTLER